jgi:nitrate/nitrite transport system permease protein
MKINGNGSPWLIRGFILVIFLGGWHLLTLGSSFEAKGKTEEQLQMMLFNGDIVRTKGGGYAWNSEKMKGVPGPLAVVEKARTELSEAFVIKGTNDHGIAYLVLYTVSRFAAGFLAASVVAILFGILLGLNRVLFQAVNPFIQLLKPISPLAWMPLLLYTVKDPK